MIEEKMIRIFNKRKLPVGTPIKVTYKMGVMVTGIVAEYNVTSITITCHGFKSGEVDHFVVHAENYGEFYTIEIGKWNSN